MSTFMTRRHCYTKKGEARGKGSHLSAQGVRQARDIGATIGPFDLVLTSHIPRTLETALAMGFSVDDQMRELGEIPPAAWDEFGQHDLWEGQTGLATFAATIAQGGATALMGEQQKDVWTQAVESVRADGNVLIISHGLVIESGLITCFPDADFSTWGNPFQHGEGAKLSCQDSQFELVRFYRSSESQTHA